MYARKWPSPVHVLSSEESHQGAWPRLEPGTYSRSLMSFDAFFRPLPPETHVSRVGSFANLCLDKKRRYFQKDCPGFSSIIIISSWVGLRLRVLINLFAPISQAVGGGGRGLFSWGNNEWMNAKQKHSWKRNSYDGSFVSTTGPCFVCTRYRTVLDFYSVFTWWELFMYLRSRTISSW